MINDYMNNIINVVSNNNKKEIVIHNKRTNLALVIFVLLFALLGFLIPIVITIYYSDRLKFRTIFSYIVLWSVSFYLLKLVLWNLFGKEIYILEKNCVTYYCDYWAFKTNKKLLKSRGIKLLYTDGNGIYNLNTLEERDTLSNIRIYLDGGTEYIESNIPLTSANILLFNKEVLQHNNDEDFLFDTHAQ